MKTIVSIPGIHCESCSALIKDVSSEFPSIQNVDVNLSSKQVIIDHAEEFDLKKWSDEIVAIDPKYAVHSVT